MELQDQPTKFFQEDSIADKYAEKYELYKKMIRDYMGGKLRAQYRGFEEIFAVQVKQLEEVKNILGKDKMPDTIDSKTILATLEAAIDSKMGIMDLVKTQQKDQDALMKLMFAQDDTLDKWMHARELELKQISVEKILIVLCDQIEWIEQQTNMVGLSATFRSNARREITKVTNCGASMFDGPEGGQKTFFKEAHKMVKENEGLTLKEACNILSQLKKDPKLKKEELIKPYIKNAEDQTSIAV